MTYVMYYLQKIESVLVKLASMIPPTVLSILEVLALIIPALLAVAYVTIAERKTMASMQRRIGPNMVGFWGSLQAFADALKLLLKEYIAPSQANFILFFVGPILTLMFSLLAFGVIPYGPGITIFNFDLGILYILTVSSISTYGILLAGWSANSKYAFLGSLRSTAQLISYELILTSAVLLAITFTASLNLITDTEIQIIAWLISPLFPIAIIFLIGAVAETNRAPFDLAEAESELVSGFMTEHSSVVFVFFFLAEYASIVIMSILISVLFLGGYSLDFFNIWFFLEIFLDDNTLTNIQLLLDTFLDNKSSRSIYSESINYGLIIGLKSSFMIFTYIWVRASFPRIRYDQLMSYCWQVLLPLLVAFLSTVPCLVYGLNTIVSIGLIV